MKQIIFVLDGSEDGDKKLSEYLEKGMVQCIWFEPPIEEYHLGIHKAIINIPQ